MARNRRNNRTDWPNKPRSARMDPKVVSAIARRRRQMLVHCFLYYKMDSPIIEDHTWSLWAQQLARLQLKYGHRIGFYDDAFADWDGSSGFHLPADADVVRVARRVHDEARDRERILS
jgi:hypothetical protein